MKSKRSKTVAFHTLGCKVNQYDTSSIRAGLLELGYREVPFGTGADLYIVNTCTVTSMAGQKSRKSIRNIRQRNPSAVLLVTGCYADSDYEVLQGMSSIDRVFTNRQKPLIPLFVAGLERIDRQAVRLSDEAHEACAAPVRRVRVSDFGSQTRAFVKIQDGCNLMCTYCIIPHVRGGLASRSLGEVLEECRALAAHGYREIVLAGIHLGAYGKDQGIPGALTELLRSMAEIPGLGRIRLSSIELQSVDPDLIELIASDSKKFCPHFHIPLQSGDSRILRRMARRYDPETYLRRIDFIRKRMPKAAFNTDVIVGFPGETDRAFEQTLSVCREVGFSKIHVFPYSERPGTPAIRFQDRVPPEVVQRRKKVLFELEQSVARAYRRQFIGQRVRVLIESRRDPDTGALTGFSDEYVRVRLHGPDARKNRLLEVEVMGLDDLGLEARI